MSVEFDFSEIRDLAATIEEADTRVRRNVRKAVEVSLFKGKKEWAAQARQKAGRHLRDYPAAIDYTIDEVGSGNRAGEISGEVGPNLGHTQGPLGIVEDAPGGVAAAPQRNYEPARKLMEEDLMNGILAALGDDGFGS